MTGLNSRDETHPERPNHAPDPAPDPDPDPDPAPDPDPELRVSPSLAHTVLRAVTQFSQDGILVLDTNREAVVMNKRFRELWCVGPEHTAYGSGDSRRAHLARLADDPEQVNRLHRLTAESRTAEYSCEVKLVTGLTLMGTSRPIFDEHDTYHGQLIVYRDLTDLSVAEAERNYFESHDQVTGLLNREAMFRAVEHRTSHGPGNSPFALILIDIDRVSRLTEQYGPSFGDRLLQRCSEVILGISGTRRPVCRHGEDTFMVLVEHESMSWIEDHALQLIDALSNEVSVDGVPISFTVSAGVSVFPHDGKNANALVSAAFIALQQAKEDGRGSVARYSEEYGRLEDERRELEQQLFEAAQGSGLELLYQPIYDLRVQELAGCEVLLRWRSQVLGPVSPAVFLPYAEESGLIIPIGEWVLRHACAQAVAWSNLDGGAFPVSVNVSARQFAAPGFAATVSEILDETKCSPFLLSLELTETTLAENPALVSHTIDAIRRLGVKVYIDDFGTGYSSLSYLKHFQVDTLKIDQSFTQGIGNSHQEDALMQAAISMAHSLGLTALAEGVETEEQLRFLMNSGCDQVQGFLLHRPMNAAQFTDLITSHDTRLPLAETA